METWSYLETFKNHKLGTSRNKLQPSSSSAQNVGRISGE